MGYAFNVAAVTALVFALMLWTAWWVFLSPARHDDWRDGVPLSIRDGRDLTTMALAFIVSIGAGCLFIAYRIAVAICS